MRAYKDESGLVSAPSNSSDLREKCAETAAGICEDNSGMKKVYDLQGQRSENPAPCDEKVEGDKEDFTFACLGSGESPISADDVFQNGQIKPIYPLFDQSILFSSDSVPSKGVLPRRPPVKKVFVETEDACTSATEEKTEGAEEEAAGPYCTWSGKAVEDSPEVCKKSNSTGFSKFWRFRGRLTRSSSDGRDAFVFLNNGSASKSSKSDEKLEKSEGSSGKKTTGEAKVNGGGGGKPGAKKAGKSQTTSAHELHYVRTRALREEDRRRSYLPYRPEVVGFFINVQGGLSRNVHPF